MPDANKENTLNQLVGAAFGAAGQRCMALSTAILVGEARNWLPELVDRAKALRVNAGARPLALTLLSPLSTLPAPTPPCPPPSTNLPACLDNPFQQPSVHVPLRGHTRRPLNHKSQPLYNFTSAPAHWALVESAMLLRPDSVLTPF